MHTILLALVFAVAQTQEAGSVDGIVVNTVTGEPIPDVSIAFATYRAAAGKDGKFSVPGVQPGRYNLIPSRNGFIITRPRPTGYAAGFPVSVGPGQQVKGIRLELTPAAAISGRILDENKQPKGSVSVSLVPANGSHRWAATSGGAQPSAQTNERGEYRLFNVTPGEYYIRVFPSGQRVDFLPALYPGVSEPVQAVRVQVAAGADLQDYDFPLVAGKKFSVKFKIGGPAPLPQGLRFSLRSATATWLPRAFLEPQISGDLYTLSGIPPGRYTVDAIWSPPAPSHSEQFAVEIVDKDVDAGTVVLTAGALIPVRVVPETPLPPSFRLESARVMFWPGALDKGMPIQATIAADGTAKMDGVAKGHYVPQLSGLPAGFYISSARYGGRDVLDSGVAVDGSTTPGSLELKIAGPAGIVEGRVSNAKGDPVSGSIVLVPSPGRRENIYFYFLTVSDQDGAFSFTGIPAGEYSVLAGDYSIADAFLNKSLMTDVLPRAAKLNVQQGSKENLDVRVIPRK